MALNISISPKRVVEIRMDKTGTYSRGGAKRSARPFGLPSTAVSPTQWGIYCIPFLHSPPPPNRKKAEQTPSSILCHLTPKKRLELPPSMP